MIVEMLVSLVIPDTTAITAANTLRKLGVKFDKLHRCDYYRFEIESTIDEFADNITKIDILVNANKHTATVSQKIYGPGLLVLPTDDAFQGLLDKLRTRLGLSEIKNVTQGTYWTVDGTDEKRILKDMAEKLLYNPNFQRYEIR